MKRTPWTQRAMPLLITLLMLLSVSAFAQVSAVPQLMNYQGRLAKPDGTPVANGNYSIRFSLWSAVTSGTEKWNQTVNPVSVRNGAFAVLLSGFPAGTFSGNLWLEIKIGTNAPLAPRQQLVSAAYAMKANSVADGTITGASIANGTITADKLAFGVGGSGWSLTGNAGIDALLNFLGTTDNKPLELRVNNRRAVKYSYAQNTATAGQEYRSINVLGGASINSLGAPVVGATLAGGGKEFFNGENHPNHVLADFGTVSGGFDNQASGYASTVPGGNSNTAEGEYSLAAGRRAKANHLGAFVWADSTDADFASTNRDQFLIRASNGVAINIEDPTGYMLKINGIVAGIGSYVSLSDGRYKQNILTFDKALDTILNLRGVTFDWKRDTPGMNFADGRQIGFIAQEVEKVLPELVTTDTKGYKSVAYANVVPVLVEAVKTLKKDNDTAHKQKDVEIAELRAKNAELEARLNRLEAALKERGR